MALALSGVPRRVRCVLAETVNARPFDALRQRGLAAVAETARGRVDDEVPALLRRLDDNGWRWIVPGESDYSEGVANLSDPPLGLFVKGEIPRARTVAVVGSRRATPYGLEVAAVLGRQMAGAGIAVASGMARGVDASAHRGALESGGPTVAVWGTGPDRVYPPEHKELAHDIASNGALLTEFPPGTPPRRHNFPKRNRVLAGLAQAVVVVEAGARSGALITARHALEEGRDVWAVPGSIFSDLSLGPNALLRAGARPLLVPAELIDDLGGRPQSPSSRPPATEDSHPLLAHLPHGTAATTDELSHRSGLPVSRLSVELLQLEVAGVVERRPDGTFVRR